MVRRKWMWIAPAALCVLAMGIGYLVQSRDELADLRALRPLEFTRDEHGYTTRTLCFRVAPELVFAKLPKNWSGFQLRDFAYHPSGTSVIGQFPSGSDVSFRINTYPWESKIRGVTCTVEVFEYRRKPWYEIAWMNLKRRLGL
jgi:hypothetical protein